MQPPDLGPRPGWLEATVRACAIALCTLLAGAPRAEDARLPAPVRLVAFGDVHGAYDDLASVLRTAGVVDAAMRWSGGATHVVSVGDLVDRGPDSRKVLDLLMRLEDEAKTAGGGLHVLVGNHEVMNLMGDLRYVSAGEIAAFAADESAEVRAQRLQEFAALPANAALSREALEQQFAKAFPPGWFAQRAAFTLDGHYGQWLLTRPVMLMVGDTVFVHGGLPPVVAELDIDAINRRYHEELRTYFAAVGTLRKDGVLTAFDDATQRLEKARNWLADPAADATSATGRAAAAVVAADESQLLGFDGPLWYRGTALCHSAIEAPTLEAALGRLGAKRVAMGHTPTPGGRIFSRFEGDALRIDTGMNRAVYKGHPAALLISGSDAKAVYVDEGEQSIAALPSYAGGERLGLAESEVLAAMTSAEVEGGAALGADTVLISVELGGRKVPAVFRWLDQRGRNHELAAYRLDRMLDLGLVPPTVIREVDGKLGILQLRPGRMQSLAELQAEGKAIGGSWCPLAPQYQLLYAFDTLLFNERRTPATIVYDTDAWMVIATGHEAAFGTAKRLPKQLANAELTPLPALEARVDDLTIEALEAQLGDLLSKREIKAILDRGRLLPRATDRKVAGL
jgi:hypothetical protein